MKKYLALKEHSGKVKLYFEDEPVQMKLPDGCTGMCFIFKTKTAARKYWGKDVPLAELEEVKNET